MDDVCDGFSDDVAAPDTTIDFEGRAQMRREGLKNLFQDGIVAVSLAIPIWALSIVSRLLSWNILTPDA